MRVTLCAEFDGSFFDMDQGDSSIFLYLSIPFGWRDSARYFPLIGNAVAVAHSNLLSRDQERDGAEYSDRQLFIEDAIFAEPDMWNLPENVVGRRGYIFRQLLGESSINVDKLGEEGEMRPSKSYLDSRLTRNL